jgi:hypothetical protein
VADGQAFVMFGNLTRYPVEGLTGTIPVRAGWPACYQPSFLARAS